MKIRDYKILQRILGKELDFVGLSVLLLFGLGLSWFSDGLTGVMKEYWFKSEKVTNMVILIISVLIIFGLYLYKRRLEKKFLVEDAIDINPVNAKRQKIKVLIVTLSELRRLSPDELQELAVHIKEEQSLVDAKSWRMPLEAIRFHKNTLEWLIILTSNESDGQFDYFKQIVRTLFGDDFKIHKEKMDMNDMEKIRQAYHEVLSVFDSYPDNEVVYDITSGSKLSTVAGAYFALNNNRLIQYVDTKTYRIRMFNNRYIEE